MAKRMTPCERAHHTDIRTIKKSGLTDVPGLEMFLMLHKESQYGLKNVLHLVFTKH